MSVGFELDVRGLIAFRTHTGVSFEGMRYLPGRYKLLQFTGLLDKNGKEIYEGDLMSYMNTEPKEVVFHKGCFCHKISDGLYHIFGDKNWEIIGNIYENPDLITSQPN